MDKLSLVDELPISSKTILELKRNHIFTIHDLLSCSEDRMMKFRHIHHGRLYEIKNAIHEVGFLFVDEDISVLRVGDDLKFQSISFLNLPLNPLKALRKANIYTIEDLLSYKSTDLKKLLFIEDFNLQLIKTALHAKGLRFFDEDISILDDRKANIYSYLLEERQMTKEEKMGIEVLNLPNYLYCILKRNRIHTVEDLLAYDIVSLSKLNHLGVVNIQKIISCLSVYDYHFKDEESIIFLKTKVKKINKNLK